MGGWVWEEKQYFKKVGWVEVIMGAGSSRDTQTRALLLEKPVLV